MSKIFIARNISLALLVFLALALATAAPAFAEGTQRGGRFCAGNSLTLESKESMESLVALGCNVTIQQGATVQNDLASFGGNVSIEGTVGGDIVMFGGNLSLDETAVVNGAITLMGGNLQRTPGATVQGGINQNRGNVAPVAPIAPIAPLHPFATNPFFRPFMYGFDLLGGIVTALAFAALGALVVIFAPNPTRRISEAAQAKPFNTAGVGCLTLILLPILSLLLLITLIGIPVALILGLLSAIAWIFGSIGVGLLAGEKILQAFKARDILPVVAVILGVVVLMVVGQVPILGWLISFIVGLIGLGAVVLTRFGTRPYPLPPGMMMTPVTVGGPSVPGTYTPSAVDTAAWEEKARRATAEASEPKVIDVPPAEMKPEPPSDLTPPPAP